VESDSAFNAITYGLGSAETYVYNAGTYVNNLNALPFLKNQYNTADTANAYTCVNTPVELFVLMRYKPSKLFWQLSKLAGTITPAIDVTDSAPLLLEEVWISGQVYYKYKLTGTYKFLKQGIHNVPFFATNNIVEQCDHTEQIPYPIEVRGPLQTDFDILYQNCKLSELIQFNGRDKFFDSSVVKRWEWSFLNNTVATTSSGKNVQQMFNTGNHSAQLIAIDANGCAADTTKPFTLSANPATPIFDAVPAFICEGGTITFTEKNPEPGVKKWYWDFDNKDTVTLTNGNPPVKTFGKYDTITVKHMVKFSDVCYSDTATQQVIIFAQPKLAIQYPAGCLPANGMVQFTSLSTAPDGQAMNPAGYTWNFGDVNASGANPNTAAIANPTHQYTNYGTYDILYRATTEKGCYRDTVIKATFNIRPQFSYGALSPVCESNRNPVSIAAATVTNGVPGSGIYKGKGVSSSGMFDAAIAGAGTHQVWYVFTTSQGCADSISQTITVQPKPTAAFVINNQICLDGTATIADQSSLSGGTISTWNWNYGDGTTELRNNGAAFTRTYSQAGSYTVQLVALGNNGCSDTVKHTLIVNPLPVAGFGLPTAVCMPAGNALFANASTISNGSSLSYTWNFGDNTSSTQTDPVHTYAVSGSYQVSLTATSAAGCTNSTSKVLDQFYNQPVASFAVNADALCQGTASLFTDNSTASNSAISSWQWAFGDGSTSANRNPSKTYAQPGNFTIQLTVKDAVGCVSEPFSKTVQVYLQPVIDAGPSFTVKEGTIVQFKATANSPSLQFVWTPGQLLSNPSILQPSLKVMDDGVYKLTATGDHNCTASDELKVLVQRPVAVPNAFSPNGDGINDTWMIKNLILYPDAILEVYNRYGQMVYRSIGYNTPWDGRMNGNPVPIGVYYYVIQLRNGDPPIKGSVTIVR
jgi:gliding motility-associated-like protein